MRRLIVLFVFALSACQSGVTSVSQRQLGYNKAGSSYMHGRSPAAEAQPDLFVRRKSLEIRPKEVVNETGSLFKIDDQRNYFYTASAPFSVNQFIDVKVMSVQEPKPKDDDAPPPAADDSGDQFVKEMLESLPELEPGPDGPKLLKAMKMKIVHVHENGDVEVTYRRRSMQGYEGNEIDIKARVPYESLIRGDVVSTNDLLDVHWVESQRGQLVERYASGWTDEFSLRVSGFSEAKSVYAQQLDDKRRQLSGVKDQLRNQLISLGKERKQLATEREALLKKQSDDKGKITELEQRVEEQATELKDLRPEEKPGDEKDGANGA